MTRNCWTFYIFLVVLFSLIIPSLTEETKETMEDNEEDVICDKRLPSDKPKGYVDYLHETTTGARNFRTNEYYENIFADIRGKGYVRLLNSSKLGTNKLCRHAIQYFGLLTNLNLANNSIAIIQPNAFHDNGKLAIINLSFNQLKRLRKGVFNINSLENLDLHWNALESIEKHAFDESPKLKILNLNYNRLGRVTDDVFSNTRLQKLYLYRNMLRVIEPNAFVNMPYLTTLDLDVNRLANFSVTWFRKTYKLENLTVNYNVINVLTENLFHKPLAKIELSNNSMEFISPLAFKKEIHYCEYNIVDLRRNKLTKLFDYTFNSCTIKNLTLSSNLLKEPPLFCKLCSINVVNLNKNPFKNLIKPAFRGIINLHEIYLQKCDLEYIHKNALANITSVRVIDLSRNELTTFPIIENLTSLTTLYLSQNNFACLHENTFSKYPKLILVDLSYNKLQFLEPAIFNKINKNAVFLLDHNNIAEYSTDWFIENKKETKERAYFVDLSFNEASCSFYDAFKNRVKYLYIFESGNETLCGDPENLKFNETINNRFLAKYREPNGLKTFFEDNFNIKEQ